MFIDLSKAFDSVSHSKLIKCLKEMGIVDKPLSLFKSYLENRVHKVKIGDTFSNTRLMTKDVPQGTVLSPLLYIIYVSELSKLNIYGCLCK